MFREVPRLTLGVIFAAVCALLAVVPCTGLILFPLLWPKFIFLSVFFGVAGLAVAGVAAGAVVHRAYHLARGRRDRDDGVTCLACGRRAFPVDGTTRSYRCGICGTRFEGPEHF